MLEETPNQIPTDVSSTQYYYFWLELLYVEGCFCDFILFSDAFSNKLTLTTKGFAPTGNIEVGELGSYAYAYAPLESNFNGRTIQGFSTEAKEKMLDCPGCPYKTYEKFFKYYGVEDYANQWVLAALNKGPVKFAKGAADFSSYTSDGIAGTYHFLRKRAFHRTQCIPNFSLIDSYFYRGC